MRRYSERRLLAAFIAAGGTAAPRFGEAELKQDPTSRVDAACAVLTVLSDDLTGGTHHLLHKSPQLESSIAEVLLNMGLVPGVSRTDQQASSTALEYLTKGTGSPNPLKLFADLADLLEVQGYLRSGGRGIGDLDVEYRRCQRLEDHLQRSGAASRACSILPTTLTSAERSKARGMINPAHPTLTSLREQHAQVSSQLKEAKAELEALQSEGASAGGKSLQSPAELSKHYTDWRMVAGDLVAVGGAFVQQVQQADLPGMTGAPPGADTADKLGAAVSKAHARGAELRSITENAGKVRSVLEGLASQAVSLRSEFEPTDGLPEWAEDTQRVLSGLSVLQPPRLM